MTPPPRALRVRRLLGPLVAVLVVALAACLVVAAVYRQRSHWLAAQGCTEGPTRSDGPRG